MTAATKGQVQMTRGQVAEALGVSIATVRRMEGNTLHPEQDERGTWRFDPAEVAAAAKRRPERRPRRTDNPGEIAARAFELFGEGYDLRQIVIKLRQPPDVIRNLYNEWLVGLNVGQRQRREEREQREHERRMRTLGSYP